MDLQEAEIRLQSVDEMIQEWLGGKHPVMLETFKFLHRLRGIATGVETTLVNHHPEAEEQQAIQVDHIVISCDASIKVNPGGPSSVGIVIQLPSKIEPERRLRRLELAQKTAATSCNQAEYDAVYFGITSLMDLRNNPGCEIEIRSDSQIVIRQLNGEMKCNDEKLKRRRDLIRELVESLPVPVTFCWRPRNSTPELEMANFLAQDLLGVRRH